MNGQKMPLVRNPDGPVRRVETVKKLPPTSSIVDATFAEFSKVRVTEDKPPAKASANTCSFMNEWNRIVKEGHF
ncbi:MAG: hypothetical protein CMK83_01805 [Pseudomonadales bacterium]|nr:hypothetical protein [Pseudomonadales bacterium]